jgi:hypothetical protein
VILCGLHTLVVEMPPALFAARTCLGSWICSALIQTLALVPLQAAADVYNVGAKECRMGLFTVQV